MAADAPKKVIAENRRARFDYFLEDYIEAGIQLLGTEIKALRDGRANQFQARAVTDVLRKLPDDLPAGAENEAEVTMVGF